MTTASVAPTITDEKLPELLGLIGGADSVELKLTVPLPTRQRAGAALGVDPLDAQIRQVYFFDTPDLALNKGGVVVRARRVQKKGDDSVVKLRPVVPDELPAELRKSPAFGVEVDAMPGGFVCSGSMKRTLVNGRERRRSGQPPAQEALLQRAASALFGSCSRGTRGGRPLDPRPVFVLKLRFSPEGFDRKLVAELWLYPDNSMILELSTKCAPGEAFQVAAETRAFLLERGVDLSGEQETKTKKALEFFSKRLADEAAA